VDVIKVLEAQQMKAELPKFHPGDTVRVAFKVVEGGRERIQPFEGTVLRRKGSGISETFTVRRVTYGIGVERTFPIHSPRLEGVEVLREADTKQARLYYLRERSGKAARVKEKRKQYVKG
jgi:large subunit ribosomal protein L19